MKTSLPHPNDIEKCNETVLNSSQTQSVQKKDINIIPYCSCKGKCSTKRCKCVKRNIPCGQSCKCDTNICLNQNSDNNFNPMQPTHEIPRSPVCTPNHI
ncbi:hypothetical protein WN51_01130 [Melipona quadrifasciata]|uniref:Tesmin/TSO1-like CXC domain-containing protein n=1 Tax=Melipona quadrifasciata TaxID=166423 RepID=A0A0M9A0A7_9HYME|nr:hypothetical protein WN51_01130 [Melipona quadrifasciata]